MTDWTVLWFSPHPVCRVFFIGGHTLVLFLFLQYELAKNGEKPLNEKEQEAAPMVAHRGVSAKPGPKSSLLV